MAIKRYKLSLLDFCLYFIFIPFLYPRGFAEYFSVYRTFFTLWLYAALGLAVLLIMIIVFKKDFRFKTSFMFLLLNYAYLILITCIKTGGISVGFQKLFVPPILVLFCSCLLEKRAYQIVRVLSNLMIFNYILGLLCDYVLFRSYFSPDHHLIFLGHVQVVSQLGILGFFLGYILYHVMNEKRKAWILWVLCIATMLLSGTLASLTVLIIIGICVLLYRLKFGTRFMRMKPTVYLIAFVIANIVLLYLSTTPIAGYNILGNMTTFNGRLYIWRAALLLLPNNWMTGFGAYGINIKVFWSHWVGDGTGFNYAHNQFLQALLDGGVIQVCLFFLMWKKHLDHMKNVLDERMRLFGTLFSVSFLAVMLAESVDIYYFVFIFMSLLAYLPKVSEIENGNKGGSGNATY